MSKEKESMFELGDIRLGQLFKIEKQTEYERLPLPDGHWIVGKVVHPHIASQDSNLPTAPALIVVWADGAEWRDLGGDLARKINVSDLKDMGDRVTMLELGDQGE